MLTHFHALITNIAKYRVLSTFNLKNADHQFPICNSDKKYTSFEANRRLYQIGRIPFVSPMTLLYSKDSIWIESLPMNIIFLYDITVSGCTQEWHDSNMAPLIKVVSKNLTLNESNSGLSSSTINGLDIG